jgi:hypothetical protein
MSDTAYLQHGKGTNGPFRTEAVPAAERGYPHPGQWVVRFEGRWRVVHQQVNRLFIVYRGERITVQLDGV